MKRIILFILISFLAGCASVKYNPETGEVQYFRMGDQHIQGFSAQKKGDNVTIKFKGQQSNAEALTEAIRLIGVLAKPSAGAP